jgi:hypothetical protein
MEAAGAEIVRDDRERVDLVLLAVDQPPAASAFTALEPRIAPAGAIWALYRRDSVKEDQVRAAALAAGLVDVKIARVADERGAMKLVIRRERR